MPRNKAERALTAERRAKLIRMRLAGHNFDYIAEQLDYSSRGAATKDMLRALEEHRAEEAAAVGTYRQQENERLDALLEAAWPRATTPSPIFSKDGIVVGEELDLRAVDTVLRLMERRAKLNGLDTPVKTELSGPEGGPLAVSTADPSKLAALIAATSRLDSDTPANTATSTPEEDDEGEDVAG